MSGAPQRGHQGGRNKRGRGGVSFGRGNQRWSRDRNDASNGGAQVQLNLQAERGRARGSRGRSRGRGIGRGGNFFRNKSATENGERFGLNHDQGRGRGTSGRSRDEMRVSSGSNIQGIGSDNESEGAWGQRGRQRGTSRGNKRGGTSRGRWRRNNTDTNADEQLDYKSLSSMLRKEPDELVLDLTSDRYFPAIESLLSQPDLPDKEVIVILRIFARACDSETSRTVLITLLNKLVSSVYLNCALTRYINCLGYSASDDERDLDNELMCMIKVFTELLKRLPTSFPNLPLPNLLQATTALMENGQLCDTKIKSSVDDLITLKDEMAEKVKKEVEVKANKPKRRLPGDKAALLDNEDPPDNYRWLRVIPQQNDVHPNGPVFIRRNKVEGSYDGPEHYLDVQFRLLREDFIRPLREGIASLTESDGTRYAKPTQDIRVYNRVEILDPVYTSKGVVYNIRFDANRMRYVRWENSKRLIYGSLLCLSKDNFETFILATVEERKPCDLRKGILKVRFKNVYEEFRKEVRYQMVETTAYYEAYCHVLEGLQEISPKNFPFEQYIVKSEPDVQAPFYLRSSEKDVTYDLSCIMKGDNERVLLSHRKKGSRVKMLDLDSWPSAKDLELDDSQLKAVQLALTKEFAIIQGPPGTGKTYIGLKVAKVLLNNKVHWNNVTSALDKDYRYNLQRTRPILVVCYTNHALDQFLEGIHEFHPEGIVRVGGRSQSEKMQACSLRTIKEGIRQRYKGKRNFTPNISQFLGVGHEQKEIRRGFYEAYEELELISKEMENVKYKIQLLTRNVIDEQELRAKDYMSEKHFKSLVARFKDIHGLGIKIKPNVMHYWLELLTNKFDFFESGYFIKPTVVYPLTATSNASLGLETRYLEPAVGPDGNDDGSSVLTASSYIIIPNEQGSLLDTRYSITILLYFYPLGPEGGPIITFYGCGSIGIQISQEGEENGKGVLSATFNSRYGECPMQPLVTKGVLKLLEWNCIGATYDYSSGILRLWHDGIMVQEQQYPTMEIASYLPVYIGAINRTFHKERLHSLLGKVSSLQFYTQAIGQEQIMAMAGLPTDDFGIKIPNEQTFETGFETKEDMEEVVEVEVEEPEGRSDVLFEANAIEDLRMLDTDEVIILQDQEDQSRHLKEDAAAALRSVINFEDHAVWHIQNFNRKVRQTVTKEMAKKDVMTNEEVDKITDVWTLSKQDKWRLYRYWIKKLRKSYKRRARRCYYEIEACAETFKALQRQEDLLILKEATIIGMTTTGAAKYRSILQAVKPRIIIVEEAAEVLESHIVTSLNPGCQHLILIGDHQQLRPSPNVYELAKDYKLDVSLFERMINNGMDYQTLHKQHRMRPEIARMMQPIYDNLENHESVLNFENIKGVNSNIFFIEHDELEEFVEEGVSRSNNHEAQYLAALCRYFILQGYDQTRITILTMYVGQLLKLKNATKLDIFQGVRICAVDNFQGEENDIILLSLVRSNKEGNIGFLRISNRVCVALSRAKKGFYCIGNLELMCKQEKLWSDIIKDMRERGNVGKSLTLMCQNHPKTIIHASKAGDFLKAPDGGCMLACNARLDCGHACRMKCHPKDPKHIEYKCLEPCTKTLCDLGHTCKRKCYEDCGPCLVPMEKIMPRCNHIQKLPCHKEPSKVQCTFHCDVFLKCGHQCKGNCTKCFQGRLHMRCERKCERILVCGHKCGQICAQKCPPCSHECENECIHQKCPNKCGELCSPCTMRCTLKCEHYECTKRCGEPCNRQRCNSPCNKTLDCGHPCIGMCGEPCPKSCRVCHEDEVKGLIEVGSEYDSEARFVELQPCGHLIEVNAMDAWMDECRNGVKISIQLPRCPVCETPIRTCPRYGNIINDTLDDIEKVKAKFVIPDNEIMKEQATTKSSFIKRMSERKDISSENAKRRRNRVIFLNLLSKMSAEISNIERESRNPEGQKVLKNSLEKEIKALEAKGIPITNEFEWYLNEQAQEELKNEILRVQLIVTYRILNALIQEKEVTLNDRDEDDVNLIGQAIDSGKCIDEEKRKQHMQTLERIRRSFGMLRQYEYSPITKEDTMEITNGIGFTQGNWFKCPLGHIYSTDGEDCPECFQQRSRVRR